MSILSTRRHNTPGKSQVQVESGRSQSTSWPVLAHWGLVLLVLIAAVCMRLYHLDLPFDRDSYDEGVYWQSLRAMLNGGHLYTSIFYSQPPLFLLSTYPGFALFGASLWSARFGIALLSLLGFAGAYLLGRTLSGRLGGLVALLLLLVDPLYLMQSQTIQAEASSVAFTFLALAFAFLGWKQPDSWRGMCWAALCGLTFALSLLCKLLCVSTIVPIGCLMLARVWQIANGKEGTSRRSWLPLLVGCAVALLAIAAGVLPYAASFQNFWSEVWTFHSVASRVAALPRSENLAKIVTGLISFTTLAALYGLVVAFLRRDWRVLPAVAWLLVTLLALFYQQPLFVHHLIALEPPLITLALLCLPGLATSKGGQKKSLTRSDEPGSAPAPANPVQQVPAMKTLVSRWRTDKLALLISIGALLLLLAAGVGGFWQDIMYYQGADAYVAGPIIQQTLRVASDLHQAIRPDQQVVTDAQFIAALADRNTPPSLVDTSSVRVMTGYVTLAQLEQESMNPRVHAVLFYTSRFYYLHQLAGFHTWVAAHFHLLYRYSPTQELWVR
ncbi:MAG TPA: glycosyltransferase family 39 protein [Ktedonobacteraceae bacterium]